MKRILAMVLAIGILFTSTIAYAEEFSLRNGITFGDTMDEVFAKETFSILKVFDEDDEDGTTTIDTVLGTIAEIPDSQIRYIFDKDKTLIEVVYKLHSTDSSKATIDNDFNNINSGLIRKYGTPLGYSNGNCYIFIGEAFESALSSLYISKLIGGYGDISDYDEWDVNTGDYHVKIEQVEYYTGSSYTNEPLYSHKVSYTYFTDEDLQNALNEKKEKQNAVDNDL